MGYINNKSPFGAQFRIPSGQPSNQGALVPQQSNQRTTGMGLGITGQFGENIRNNLDGFTKARGDLIPLYEQAQAMYEPYMGLAGGLGQLQSDISGGMYNTQFSNVPQMERFNFEEDPGYQFAMEEGTRGVNSQLAAAGLRGGGAAMKGMERFRQGLAGQQINDAFARHQGIQGNRLGLAQLGANVEQMRSNQLQNQMQTQYGIGAAGLGLLGSAAGLKTGLAGNLVDLQIGKYQADQARKIAKDNNKAAMTGSMIGGGAALLESLFSDIRLKENVDFKRQEKGHNIYEFSYKGDPRRFEGVIAQEVQEAYPEAVIERDGFLAVNYDLLGLDMKEVK